MFLSMLKTDSTGVLRVLVMANVETTFEDFQISEHLKRLKRSMKLTLLKKAHSKNVQDGKMIPLTTWPSISSINVDSSNSNCGASLLQTSVVKSEVLASSNNLRKLLLTKTNYKTDKEITTTTSSVKQDNHNDQLVMPPPMKNIVYTSKEMQSKVPTLLNCKLSNLLNNSVQSATVRTFSSSTANHISANANTDKECLHSFDVPVTSINDHQRVDRIFLRWRVMLNDHYELIIKGTLECGRIAHSKPVVRRYTATCVESKYKHKYRLQGNIVDERNVLPDYVRGKFYNGFPDDWENVYQLWKTYVRQGCPVTFRWPTPITDSDDDLKSEITDLTYVRTRNSNFMKTHDSIEYATPENPTNKSPKEKKKYQNCSIYSFQKENFSVVKPFVFKKDIIPVAQTSDIKLVACDKNNEQSIELNVNSKGIKLKNIIHEDKLNIIINNLADRNCSPKYIDNIIEMFNCLDYAISYGTRSECNEDTASISANRAASLNDDRTNTSKSENGIKKQWKNFTDPRYGSTNYSNQSLNTINIKPKHNANNSDESESETYGVPKISNIEQILHASNKIYRHKIKRKNPHKGFNHEFGSTYVAINNKKNLPSDKSCSNITEDKTKENKECKKIITENAQKLQEDIFCSHPGNQKSNCDDANKPAVQDKRLLNAFEAPRVNLPDINVVTYMQEADGNMIVSHSNLDQDTAISSENNNNLPEKPLVFRESNRENIIDVKHNQFVNLKLSIKAENSKSEHIQALDMNSVENQKDKDYFNIQSSEEVHKKKSKIMADKKKIYVTINKENESNVNFTNLKLMTSPTIKEAKNNKLEIKDNFKVLSAWMPKVIHYAKSESGLGLTFEGKLLNEVGHVAHRKFTTDIILKRLSATLIETVNHELYQLFGNLNDNKHIIPKELAKQCRNGCPADIEQFCLAWKKLQNCRIQKTNEILYDTSKNSLNTPISSRGRRIVPTLSYWTGERITLKDNNLVYNPGSSQESSLYSLMESSKELSTGETKKVNSKNASKEQKVMSKSNETPDTNKNQTIVIKKAQSSNKATVNRSKRSNKFRKIRIYGKRHIKQNLTFSSTDEEENISPPKRKRTRKSIKIEAPSQSTMTLRKQHKIQTISE